MKQKQKKTKAVSKGSPDGGLCPARPGRRTTSGPQGPSAGAVFPGAGPRRRPTPTSNWGGGCLIHDWGRQSKENLHFKHAPTYPRAKGQLWTKTRPDRSLLFMPPQPPLKCSCRPTANRPAAPRVGAQRDDRRCGVAGRRRRPRRTSRALVVIVQLPRILLEFSCGHPFVSRQPFQNFASRPTDPVWLCNEPHRSPRTGFSKTFAA
jgi:hypothetical protein